MQLFPPPSLSAIPARSARSSFQFQLFLPPQINLRPELQSKGSKNGMNALSNSRLTRPILTRVKFQTGFALRHSGRRGRGRRRRWRNHHQTGSTDDRSVPGVTGPVGRQSPRRRRHRRLLKIRLSVVLPPTKKRLLPCQCRLLPPHLASLAGLRELVNGFQCFSRRICIHVSATGVHIIAAPLCNHPHFMESIEGPQVLLASDRRMDGTLRGNNDR